MRVGLIAPPWVAVPPPAYGGTEVVIDNLARGLHERGHDVRLFTVGESTCPVPRDYLYPKAVGTADGSVEEAAHVLAAYDEIGDINDIDLIHDHTVLGPLLAAPLAPRHPPIVTTFHGEFTAANRRIFARIATGARIVAISHAQAAAAPEVPIAAVIHHGIDLDVYQQGDGAGGYLLFLGRMSPTKGVHLAVRMARQSGQRLILAAKMREPAEWTYYEQCVRPLLGGDDDLWIEPTLSQRLDMLRGATALLNPICWPEPFGLVMIEALAPAHRYSPSPAARPRRSSTTPPATSATTSTT